MALLYADSSALVKLVRDEPESEALRATREKRPDLLERLPVGMEKVRAEKS